MSQVVSCRLSREELLLVAKAQRQLGTKSRAETVRTLVQKGAAGLGSWETDPLLTFRLPKRLRGGPTTTKEEIDETLYGRPD